MANFMIHFLLCNIIISGIIVVFLMIRKLLTNKITNRCKYNIWFLLLGLLTVPFLPLKSFHSLQFFSWLNRFIYSSIPNGKDISVSDTDVNISAGADWINDFTLSVSRKTPSIAGIILIGIWMIGILAMTIWIVKSKLRLNTLKKSALPLQNQAVHQLYRSCLMECNINKTIPVYSTAFLKSPIIAGIFKPCIYIPYT